MYIITGASKGIGAHLCKHFASKGEPVAATYNTTQPTDIPNVRFSKVDISNSEQVTSWIQSLAPDLNQIKLINCAGINCNGFAHKADLKAWENVVRTNLFGSFYTIHSLLPTMRKQGFGRIVNFGSVVAQTPTPGVSAYAASKSGLWGLSKSLAAENGKLNITINTINLGYVELGIIREVSEEFQQSIKSRIPSGKFAQGSDIARTIEYLFDCPYINGADIDVNGGLI